MNVGGGVVINSPGACSAVWQGTLQGMGSEDGSVKWGSRDGYVGGEATEGHQGHGDQA
jgi:hypothetical protein